MGGRKSQFNCINNGRRKDEMPKLDRIVSYISVTIVLLVGIVVMSGFIGILEPSYRFGFGLIIIAYAGVRLLMIYRSGRDNREKP